MQRYRLVHESAGLSFVRYRLRPEEDLVVLRSDQVGSSELDGLLPIVRAGGVWKEEGGYLGYSGQILPSVKVFERVRGAVLEGTVAPGGRVTL